MVLRAEKSGALSGGRGPFKAVKQVQPQDRVEAYCGEDAEALDDAEVLRGSGLEADGAHKHHSEGNGGEDCYRADTPVLAACDNEQSQGYYGKKHYGSGNDDVPIFFV